MSSPPPRREHASSLRSTRLCGAWPRSWPGAPASEHFLSTVAREVASVLKVPGVIVDRYDADGTIVTVGDAFDSRPRWRGRFLGVGTRMPRRPRKPRWRRSSIRTARRESMTSRRYREQLEILRARRDSVPAVRGPIVVNGHRLGRDVRLLAGRDDASRWNGGSPPRLHRARCDGDRELRGARRAGSVGGARPRARRRTGGAAPSRDAGCRKARVQTSCSPPSPKRSPASSTFPSWASTATTPTGPSRRWALPARPASRLARASGSRTQGWPQRSSLPAAPRGSTTIRACRAMPCGQT